MRRKKDSGESSDLNGAIFDGPQRGSWTLHAGRRTTAEICNGQEANHGRVQLGKPSLDQDSKGRCSVMGRLEVGKMEFYC